MNFHVQLVEGTTMNFHIPFPWSQPECAMQQKDWM
jgi:hypothetical protein